MDTQFILQSAMFSVASLVLLLLPTWRIFKRAGLSPWGSLWVLFPYIGFWIASIVLAASKWNFDKS